MNQYFPRHEQALLLNPNYRNQQDSSRLSRSEATMLSFFDCHQVCSPVTWWKRCFTFVDFSLLHIISMEMENTWENFQTGVSQSTCCSSSKLFRLSETESEHC